MARLDSDQDPWRRLDDLVGQWNISGSYQPWDGATDQPVNPACTVRWIVGRRCLELRYRYTVPGGPIEDLYLLRWNPLGGCYEIQIYSSGWTIPNGGTGHWDEQSASLEFVLETINPANSLPIRTLYRLEALSENAHTWRQYRSASDGTLTPFFTMHATRVDPVTP